MSLVGQFSRLVDYWRFSYVELAQNSDIFEQTNHHICKYYCRTSFMQNVTILLVFNYCVKAAGNFEIVAILKLAIS